MRLYKVAILQDVAVSHPQVGLKLAEVLSEPRYESITSVASPSPLTSAATRAWPADLLSLRVPIPTSFTYLGYVLPFSLYLSSRHSITFYIFFISSSIDLFRFLFCSILLFYSLPFFISSPLTILRIYLYFFSDALSSTTIQSARQRTPEFYL